MKALNTLDPEHAEYHRRSHDKFCPELCNWDEYPAVQMELKRQRSLALMESVEEFKQAVDALVKGLVADGFSDEQARDIVSGFWRTVGKEDES